MSALPSIKDERVIWTLLIILWTETSISIALNPGDRVRRAYLQVNYRIAKRLILQLNVRLVLLVV